MKAAVISPCGQYRYRLERVVAMEGPVFAFFGVNPSTADASLDDATVRKWTGFVKRWGGSRFIVGNVSPYRATDVRALATVVPWKHIERENQLHLHGIVADADILVPCWGDRKKVPRVMHNTIDQMLAWLIASGKPVKHFGLTVGGDPKHPLMLGYDTSLSDFQQRAPR